jgi:hypothetical protein
MAQVQKIATDLAAAYFLSSDSMCESSVALQNTEIYSSLYTTNWKVWQYASYAAQSQCSYLD